MTSAGSVDWPGVVRAVATLLVGEPTHKNRHSVAVSAAWLAGRQCGR